MSQGKSGPVGVGRRGPEPPGYASSTVTERFDYWVAHTPEAPALILESGETFTYTDIYQEATKIALHLADSSEVPASPVAFFMREPRWAVSAMLGALRAGRLFVMVDPLDAPARLRRILNHSEADLILTSEAGTPKARAVASPSAKVVSLQNLLAAATDGEAPPIGRRSVDEAAHIMYTSGSTGLPKGVLSPESSLLRKARLHEEILSVGPGDRVSLVFSPAFAAANTDIFGALLNGAAVVPFDLPGRGLAQMAGWLGRNEITVLHTFSTVLRRIDEMLDPAAQFPALRSLVLGGESLTRRDLESIWPHLGANPRVWYRLSTSETGPIASTVLDAPGDFTGELVPIGYPVSGIDVLLVDQQGKVVSEGQAGEMYVRGDHLALGYLKGEALTSTKFGYQYGGRAYRTGDIARRDSEGRLHFLGRTGGRLKLSGHTVEVKEVERALYETGRFSEVTVVGRQVPSGAPELVAFLVPEGVAVSAPSLRSELSEILPSYMIPTSFVELEALPLTSVGKIDLDELPWPSPADRPRTTPPVPASTDLEKTLLDIWRDILGLTTIGVRDDYFDSGGTSIQALRIFALISHRLNVDIPPTTILQAPTIEQLARVIGDGVFPQPQASLVPVRVGSQRPPFFCVHGGGGGVLFLPAIARHLDLDQPLYGLQAEGFDGTPGPYRPVEELAARYLEEMRSVQPKGPYYIGGLSFGGKVAYEMAQQLVANGEDVALLALLDTQMVSSDEPWGFRRLVARMDEMTLRQKLAYWIMIGRRGSLARGIGVLSLRSLLNQVALRRGKALSDIVRAREHHFGRNFHEAGLAYQPGRYSGGMVVLGAHGTAEKHGATWGGLAGGSFEIVELPADHAGMIREPAVEILAGHLQERIRQAI